MVWDRRAGKIKVGSRPCTLHHPWNSTKRGKKALDVAKLLFDHLVLHGHKLQGRLEFDVFCRERVDLGSHFGYMFLLTPPEGPCGEPILPNPVRALGKKTAIIIIAR